MRSEARENGTVTVWLSMVCDSVRQASRTNVTQVSLGPQHLRGWAPGPQCQKPRRPSPSGRMSSVCLQPARTLPWREVGSGALTTSFSAAAVRTVVAPCSLGNDGMKKACTFSHGPRPRRPDRVARVRDGATFFMSGVFRLRLAGSTIGEPWTRRTDHDGTQASPRLSGGRRSDRCERSYSTWLGLRMSGAKPPRTHVHRHAHTRTQCMHTHATCAHTRTPTHNMCAHACTHTHTHAHRCTLPHMHMCAHTSARTHTCVHICTHTFAHTHMHARTCTHTCVHTQAHRGTHICTHTYTCTDAHTPAHVRTCTHPFARAHTRTCVLTHTIIVSK